ncbi:hypothetical protein BN1088_1431499 [Sphingobacterium sp. PM2-P1-29]|nr:hypothetical protein BN1088_1431499 [Sphingobacterium sp. PM2-P1-29]
MLIQRCQQPLKKYKIQYPFSMDKYSKQMENKLYREVSVSDRLPQTSGSYLTNNGKRLFSDHINVWQRNENEGPVEWWLEVVKLPTNEEIARKCGDIAIESGSVDIGSHFMRGIIFLTDYLKGGKDE